MSLYLFDIDVVPPHDAVYIITKKMAFLRELC